MQQAKNFEKEEKATARICILEELPNQALMMRKITQNVENLSMQKTGNSEPSIQYLAYVEDNPVELTNQDVS